MVNAATNRITSNGAVYDANGNMTANGSPGQVTGFGYDEANRLSGVQLPGSPGNGSMAQYSYDAANQRIYASITTTVNSVQTTNNYIYFYGADGKKLGVSQLTTPNGYDTLTLVSTNVWFGGRLVANGSWTHEDRLQSVGKYFPYGEDRYNPTPVNPSNDQEKFATYTRDSISGLDYAVNRYYAAGMGRFMSADPYNSSNVGAPQSWNRYAYSYGDPINYLDPSGRSPCGSSWNTANGVISVTVFDCAKTFDVLPGDIGATTVEDGATEKEIPHPSGLVPVGRPLGSYNLGSSKVTTITQAHNVLKLELQNLSPNCRKVLPPMRTLVADSLAVVYWDARPSAYGSITISDAIPGYSWSGTFQNTVGSFYAVDLLDGNGIPTQNIDLGSAFFDATAARQGLTLLHELLPYETGPNHQQFDEDPKDKIAIQNGDNASSALTAWLSNDCKN
jgi:RHS repeat-associated protein